MGAQGSARRRWSRTTAGAAAGAVLAAGLAWSAGPPAGAAPLPPDVVPQLAVAAFHDVVLGPDGTVWTFGTNGDGQLGRSGSTSTPTPVPGLTDIVDVAADEYHSVALHADGTVSTFGKNDWGQLGVPNSTPSRSTPAVVAGLSDIVSVSAGLGMTAALDRSGRVWTFGDNFYGQLGTPTNSGMTAANPTPTQVPGLTDVVAVDVGGYNTLVLRRDGTVWAFGQNQFGQLGVVANAGTTNATATPVQVPGLGDVVALAAGQYHSAVLAADGTVWTFGLNQNGQLGRAANLGTNNPNTTPTQVAGITDAVAIATDELHVMVLRADGTVWAFGANNQRQLGNPTGVGGDVATPVQVDGAERIVAIGAGQEHSLVVRDDGTVWGVGSNNSGQLGATNLGGAQLPLQQVAGLDLSPSVTAASAAARLMDTRPGRSTVDGADLGGGQRMSGSTYELTVAGRGGVPTGATAAALNLTVTNPKGTGFVTAYPCGETRPTASNLNFRLDQTVANLAVAKLGTGGKVCLYVEGAATDLVVDVDRSQPAGAAFSSITPARLLDTRNGQATVDGAGAGGGAVAGGTTKEITVTGRAGVTGTDAAVVLNVTATGGTGPGFVTVYPCGSTRPLASTLNFVAGSTVANVALTRIGDGGKVCAYVEGAPTDLVVDVTGAYPVASPFASLVPARLVDSRTGETTVDGRQAAIGRRASGSVTEVEVAGRAGVPFSADQVALNITAVGGDGVGLFTVYPCGAPRPVASTLNYATGQTVANVVLAKVGDGGKVCVYGEGASTDLVVDVTGYTRR